MSDFVYEAEKGRFLVVGRNPSERDPDRDAECLTLHKAIGLAEKSAKEDKTRIYVVYDDQGHRRYVADAGATVPA